MNLLIGFYLIYLDLILFIFTLYFTPLHCLTTLLNVCFTPERVMFASLMIPLPSFFYH